MKRWEGWFILAVLTVLHGPAGASSGTEGAAFLDIPVGAAPAALGSAYTALATDAYAPVYNPAGMGRVVGTEVAAQHLSYLASINYEFLSVVHAIGQGKSLGLSAQYLGTGSINGTDQVGNADGSYTSHYAAYSLAYGQKITDTFSLGFTGKLVNAQIADVSANAYAADIGALYQPTDRFNLALTGTNLGTKLKFSSQGDTLPEAVHVGAAFRAEKHCVLTVEGVHDRTGLNSGRMGVEYSPMPMIKLRAGYKTDTTKGLGAMAGLTTGVGLDLWGQEFSYAWLPYGDLGSTQYFSLLLRFGKESEERRNLIQGESVHRHRTVRNQNSKTDDDRSNDVEYQQLMQLLDDSATRNAQAPKSASDQ